MIDLIGLAIMGFILGFLIGASATAEVSKGEAIKYHHAYYHQQTGEFTWKKECK